MRYCVSEIREVLLQAFGAVDLQEYGTVGADVVRRVLDNFCFIMTNKQFNVSIFQQQESAAFCMVTVQILYPIKF